MLTAKVKEALKRNWGEKAMALDCSAEVKLIDPLSSWACYIYAMDESERIVHCLIYTNTLGPEICSQCLYDLYLMYNEHGEHPVVDKEFRRTRIFSLLKRLKNDT